MASNTRPVTQIERWPQAAVDRAESVTDAAGNGPRDNPDSHEPAEISSAKIHRKRKRGNGHASESASMFPDLPLQVETPTMIGSSMIPIPQHRASPWTRYQEKYKVDLNGMVTVAESRGTSNKLVTVRQTSNVDLDRKIRLLTQLRKCPSFVACIELFLSDSIVHIVGEFMDLTLLHVLGVPVFLSEKEVAAIAGQGSALLFICALWLTVADPGGTSIPTSASSGSWKSYTLHDSG